MVVQLFLIGIYLKYLFLWDNPWINFLWVFIMVFVATETALSRTRLKRNILMIPIVVGSDAAQTPPLRMVFSSIPETMAIGGRH